MSFTKYQVQRVGFISLIAVKLQGGWVGSVLAFFKDEMGRGFYTCTFF